MVKMDEVWPIIYSVVHLYQLHIQLTTLYNFQVEINTLHLNTKPIQIQIQTIYLSLSGPTWLPNMSAFFFTLTAEEAHNARHRERARQQRRYHRDCTGAAVGSFRAGYHQFFTADYIIEVGEITVLFMLPSRHFQLCT